MRRGDDRGALAVIIIITDKLTDMHTYIIKYKEYGREWSSTSYTCQRPVTREYLIQFFGLEECEDYLIEEESNN